MAENTTKQSAPEQPDAQILVAIQEVLLNARISNLTGNEDQWIATNPVLKNGEVGFISESAPLRFKVGNGVDPWSSRPWANVQTLAQLAEDATHRLVTDGEKAGWNDKVSSFAFDYALYTSGTPVERAMYSVMAAAIVATAHTEKHPLIIVLGARPGSAALVALRNITNTRVEGVILDFDASTTSGNSIAISYNTIVFTSEGKAMLSNTPRTPWLLTTSAVANDLTTTDATKVLSAAQGKVLNDKIAGVKVPEYSLAKVTTEVGFASTYHLQRDNVKVGASINIPLDQVLRASSIKSVTTVSVPYPGAKVGDKYIEFLFQNNNTPQYLPVKDLVDIYTGDNTYIQVSPTNVIQLKYAELKAKLQSDFNVVYDAKGAGAAAAQAAVDAFARKDFVIKCTIPGLG